jgi:hypothetical protein
MPATSAVFIDFFSSFLLRPLTVLMKQTRHLVRAVKQSTYLDVYGTNVNVNDTITTEAGEKQNILDYFVLQNRSFFPLIGIQGDVMILLVF